MQGVWEAGEGLEGLILLTVPKASLEFVLHLIGNRGLMKGFKQQAEVQSDLGSEVTRVTAGGWGR